MISRKLSFSAFTYAKKNLQSFHHIPSFNIFVAMMLFTDTVYIVYKLQINLSLVSEINLEVTLISQKE